MSANEGASPPPTVLVVEDDINLQFLIEQQLELVPAQPVIHGTGQAALEWLESNQADVVVLDLMLPGMDGYEICRRIRLRYAVTALPILMLSALGDQVEARIKGIQAGANDFLAKPYHLQEFLAHVRMLAGVKAETQQTETLLARYTSRVMREQARLTPATLAQRQQRDAVILFADMRGFTHLSSQIGADAMMAVLDEFFEAMLKIVDEHSGTVFDLIGDEFLAGFNVPVETPGSAALAVKAALAMGERFHALQAEWAKAGYAVGIGIGLHSGEVTLGNVGSDTLTRYTVMGSVVNMAHRLVELASDGQLVLSEPVRQAIGSAAPPNEAMGKVTLKGIDEPQELYRMSLYTSVPPLAPPSDDGSH